MYKCDITFNRFRVFDRCNIQYKTHNQYCHYDFVIVLIILYQLYSQNRATIVGVATLTVKIRFEVKRLWSMNNIGTNGIGRSKSNNSWLSKIIKLNSTKGARLSVV